MPCWGARGRLLSGGAFKLQTMKLPVRGEERTRKNVLFAYPSLECGMCEVNLLGGGPEVNEEEGPAH